MVGIPARQAGHGGWHLLAGICFAFLSSQALAQQAERDIASGRWQLETLRLVDGKQYRGLVQDEGELQIDFAEIVQPAGMPMYAVIRGIERRQVAQLERLLPAEHEKLEQRFHQFRNRAVIEAGLLEQVKLQAEVRGGIHYWVYRGDWFELQSTTDNEATRRCVVRIEQIFRAFRNLFPPRIDARRRLQVQVFGSMDDYRTRLKQLGLSLTNPACYAPRERLILAGSELTPFAERLAQTRRDHAAVRKQYAQLDGEFAKSMNRLSGELKASGFTSDEITSEIRLRKTGWKGEMENIFARISEIDRRNAARFGEVTQQMFSRLYHEAFHAYLDLCLYPHDERHVPRWLNEGLAQVFERAQLDGDTLRIDAPDRKRLRALQTDRQPLPLSTLLSTEHHHFLASEFQTIHASADSQRTYLYSWALAYYLAFQEYRLTDAAFDEYISPHVEDVDPLQKFEKLVGRRLPEFEREFTETMLNLNP